MFITWGKKLRTRRVGYVADFCVFCRDRQTFLLQNLMLVRHVQGITLGKGERVRTDAICQNCKGQLISSTDRYAMVEKENDPVPDRLQALTFPNYEQFYAERLKIERQIYQDPFRIDPQIRRDLIAEPFKCTAPLAEELVNGETHMDLNVGVAFLCSAVTLTLAIFLFSFTGMIAEPWALWILLIIGITGGLTTLWFVFTANRRLIRRKLFPQIFRSLKPLRPSEEELMEVLRHYSKYSIGKKMKMEDFRNNGVIR